MVTDIDDVLIPFAKQHGVGVINASALHMGLLTKSGAPGWHPAPKEVVDAGRKVVALCEAEGIDAPRLALRFCLDHPDITSTLIGMSTRQQVEANLNALSLANDRGVLEKIRGIVAPVHNYVWPSGREENHG